MLKINTEEKEILLDKENFETLGIPTKTKKSDNSLTSNNKYFTKSILDFKKEIFDLVKINLNLKTEEKIEESSKSPISSRRSKSIIDIDHLISGKIQASLNDISLSKNKNSSLDSSNLKNKVISNKTINKNKSIEETEGYRNSIYSRGIQNLSKLNNKIKNIKLQKLNEEMTILTSKIKKPINTEKIIKEKLKDTKPIYERIKEIVETKKNKIETLQKNVIQKQKKDEEERKRQEVKSNNFDEEKFSHWVETNHHWNDTKCSKIVRIKKAIKKNEEETLKSFHHPKIDKVSEDIVNKSRDKSSDKVFERLYQTANFYKKRINKLKREQTPNFEPTLNRTFVKKYSPDKRIEKLLLNFNNLTTSLINNTSLTINIEKNYSARSPKIADLKGNLGIIKNLQDTYNSALKKYVTENDKQSNYRLPIKNDKINKINHYNDWQDTIDSVNDGKKNSTNMYDDLYKINIRNSSAWDKNRENKVVFLPTYTNNSIVSNLIEKRTTVKKK